MRSEVEWSRWCDENIKLHESDVKAYMDALARPTRDHQRQDGMRRNTTSLAYIYGEKPKENAMRVFEYVVIETKRADCCSTSKETKILVGPLAIVAPNEESVKKRAIRDAVLPAELDIDDVEVLVRPFV